MFSTLPANVSLEVLQSLDKQSAGANIIEAFQLGDIDANQAFALASECGGVELRIVPVVDARD